MKVDKTIIIIIYYYFIRNDSVVAVVVCVASLGWIRKIRKHLLKRWRSWLRHCATSWKVKGLIPDGFTGIFHWHDPYGHSKALEWTQPLTEMSTINISLGGKGGPFPPLCADCLELWEPHPPGTLRICPGRDSSIEFDSQQWQTFLSCPQRTDWFCTFPVYITDVPWIKRPEPKSDHSTLCSAWVRMDTDIHRISQKVDGQAINCRLCNNINQSVCGFNE